MTHAGVCFAGCAGAGRTDRGVHAVGQLVSFHSAVLLDPAAVCLSTARVLHLFL